ncbi:MAG TPA: hypothetical protein PLL75_05355 [Candidatus Omnitrophota bacterium]|nr:hypothetical protein [Candidatus Omnitrophota bacterium]HPS37135.1 hypothetical protein [Candidatus Omnitrophota bacterium]
MLVYPGIFLIAFATLAFEVTLTRILSVCTWYHLAFFAISTAMLGMTAGATTVFLKPRWFEKERLSGSLAVSCLLYALCIPFTLALLCYIPLPNIIVFPSADFITVMIVAFACSLPFYFSGIAISALLTKTDRSVNKIYAADLVGAAFGCVFVLAGLEWWSAPNLVLITAWIGTVAAFCFIAAARLDLRSADWKRIIALGVLVLVATLASWGIQPHFVKGKVQNPEENFLDRWNSFSWVVSSQGQLQPPQFWGRSPQAPGADRQFQYTLKIDGCAGTVVTGYSSKKDIEHLGFDVINIGQYLRPTGPEAVIGVGGGRDILSGLLFGHERIVGLDVNPIFIDLQKKEFRKFTRIADQPGVVLVADEARSYLSRSKEEFSFIQMSLIDTWAATGAGAFTLTENSLYTVEGWQVFLDRLRADGIFSVARHYNPESPSELGRLLSLAVASLLRHGIQEPPLHIAVISCKGIATLLLKKTPFTPDEIGKLAKISSVLEYQILVAPGKMQEDPVLASILTARSEKDLDRIGRLTLYNLSASTDEKPYFFNIINLKGIFMPIKHPGVASGNMIATATLLQLILALGVLTVVTILIPLAFRPRGSQIAASSGIFWPAAFFSLIGAGFMFVELGLIQRLSVFLGHPAYALGVLLFTIILSTGAGSFLSEKLPLTRFPWIYALPAGTGALILFIRSLLSGMFASMVSAGMFLKILASVFSLAPMGILLGFFFPLGMRLARERSADNTPWYWALNGIFGVLCSALAVFFAIYTGISTNFYLAAFCYLLTGLCLFKMTGIKPRNH